MITPFAERLWALWAAEKESVEIQKRAFSSVLIGMLPYICKDLGISHCIVQGGLHEDGQGWAFGR